MSRRDQGSLPVQTARKQVSAKLPVSERTQVTTIGDAAIVFPNSADTPNRNSETCSASNPPRPEIESTRRYTSSWITLP